MKRQGIVIVVHFDITLVFADSFPDAFYAETMPSLIRFIGGQSALRIGEWIFPAGVYDRYHDKWGIGPSGRSYFNKSFGNAAGGFHGIVQQVAEQGSEVAVCDKVGCSMPDIHMKRDMFVVALPFILTQNGVEHLMVA